MEWVREQRGGVEAARGFSGALPGRRMVGNCCPCLLAATLRERESVSGDLAMMHSWDPRSYATSGRMFWRLDLRSEPAGRLAQLQRACTSDRKVRMRALALASVYVSMTGETTRCSVRINREVPQSRIRAGGCLRSGTS